MRPNAEHGTKKRNSGHLKRNSGPKQTRREASEPGMMNFFPVLFCISLGFLACWLAIPVIRKHVAKRSDLARRGEFHHTHTASVPRYGGLALATSFALLAVAVSVFAPIGHTSLSGRLALIFGSLAMFGLGFWDDIKPLGAKVKLLGQIA